MRLSLIGMAGTGKSYWASKLVEKGFMGFCCDDLIEARLGPELMRPDGTAMTMGQWMAFPFEPQYRARESGYLAYEKEVLAEIIDYLENHEKTPEERIVVDTTGSVIYADEEIITKLRQYTRVVYLPITPQIQERLLKAYVSRPHPMLWGDVFSKEPDETNEESLARCYPKLVSARERLYERYADVTIDSDRCREEGFSVSDLLDEVGASEI